MTGRRVWLILVAFIAAHCPGQEPAATDPSDSVGRERWQPTYRAIAESITMRRGETRLTLIDKPLLFYTNPVRTNDQHGAVFLWTEAQRPAVIGSIWSAINRQNPATRAV